MPLATLHPNGRTGPPLLLHYELTASPDGARPAVVFLHGLGSSAADWALQAPIFAQHYRVLTVDLRAHGQSSDPGGWFTVEQLADDVACLLEQLVEPPAHFVGLSLGGCTALALAVRHPARVRSLTLVNAFARYRPAGRSGLMRQIKRTWLLLTAPMPVMAAFIADGLFPKPEQGPFRDAAIVSLGQNRKRAYFAAMRALSVFDMRRSLAALRAPTLIIAGDRDTTVARSAQHLLHRSIPDAQLLIIPDSGHATPYDQSEMFNRAVLEFIGGH
jgi:pimeloyl-ACP methyl ester carboxylesterase